MIQQLNLFQEDGEKAAATPAHPAKIARSGTASKLAVFPTPALTAAEQEIEDARKHKARRKAQSELPPPIEDLCREPDEHPPFPIDLLPSALKDIVQETAKAYLIPESLPAVCALAGISEVLGAGLEVSSDPAGNSTLAGNLFILAVAESGTGKGRAYNEIMRPLDTLASEARKVWEESDRPRIDTEIEEQLAVIARVRKELTKTKDATERVAMKQEMRDAIQALNAAKTELTCAPVWNAGEATREVLARLASGQIGEAISSRSGEARGILSVLGGRYSKGKESDEDIFLHLYSRDPKSINRQSAEPIESKKPTGTVCWLIQPDKVRELLGMANMTESGLLPRFIAFDSEAQAEDVPEQRHLISEDSKAALVTLLTSLANEYRANGNAPRIVEPCKEAFDLFRTFDNETRASRRHGGDAKDIAAYAARWAENAWRLALVIHAATHRANAHHQPLSLRTAESAIALMRWFIGAQLRLLASGRNARRDSRLADLRSLLIRGPVSLRDLFNSHGFPKSEVEALATANSALLEVITRSTGGRPTTVVKLKELPPS